MAENSEQQLWCSVITQAMFDVQQPLPGHMMARLDLIRTREWLTKPNRDFNEVCALAQIEPDKVRAAAVTLINEVSKRDWKAGDQSPDANTEGNGSRLKPNSLLFHDGRSLTVSQWSAETGISKPIIYKRLRAGMDVEEALTKPIRTPRHRGVGQNFKQSCPDRSFFTAQESTTMDFSR